MVDLVVADIGGTHARFALAEVTEGRVVRLDQPTTLRTADHAGLRCAWQAFGAEVGRALPRAAVFAVASPVGGETIRFTNNAWVIDPRTLRDQLGLDRFELVNDFGAIGHAVAHLPSDQLLHICGPTKPLPDRGVISVVGPGTGLGVAMIVRTASGDHVIETEGGHVGYAPLDPSEDAVLARMRARFGRVSVERIVAGPGLAAIYETLATLQDGPQHTSGDAAIWAAALDRSDPLAVEALDCFLSSLGVVVGDLALAQGAGAVVIAGGLGLKLGDRLTTSNFVERFVAKGRFRPLMEAMPVKLITHPQPGLLGAAAIFAQRRA